MKASIVRFTLFCSFLLPAHALGSEPEPTDVGTTSARTTGGESPYETMLRLSDEATDAVLSQQYEIGAVKFRLAYAAYPDPILLKNEMISWYRAGDCRSALPPAQAFLLSDEVEPQDRIDVATVELECYLNLADAALDQEELILAAFYLDTLETMANTAASLQRYDVMRERLDALTPREELPFLEEEPSLLSRRDLGWLQITGGFALAGVGAALHSVALDRQAQLREFAVSENPQDAQLFHLRQQEWGAYQRTTAWVVPTLYILGGIAFGSGVIFISTADSSPPVRELTIAPEISSRSVGVQLSQRF